MRTSRGGWKYFTPHLHTFAIAGRLSWELNILLSRERHTDKKRILREGLRGLARQRGRVSLILHLILHSHSDSSRPFRYRHHAPVP